MMNGGACRAHIHTVFRPRARLSAHMTNMFRRSNKIMEKTRRRRRRRKRGWIRLGHITLHETSHRRNLSLWFLSRGQNTTSRIQTEKLGDRKKFFFPQIILVKTMEKTLMWPHVLSLTCALCSEQQLD